MLVRRWCGGRVVDAHVDGGGLHDEDREQGGELVQGQDERLHITLCARSEAAPRGQGRAG
eukprot:COSAG06_NODE_4747_length_3986_cov_6.589658_5_plen_60_part_00